VKAPTRDITLKLDFFKENMRDKTGKKRAIALIQMTPRLPAALLNVES
jgi:hypothetical protein